MYMVVCCACPFIAAFSLIESKGSKCEAESSSPLTPRNKLSRYDWMVFLSFFEPLVQIVTGQCLHAWNVLQCLHAGTLMFFLQVRFHVIDANPAEAYFALSPLNVFQSWKVFPALPADIFPALPADMAARYVRLLTQPWAPKRFLAAVWVPSHSSNKCFPCSCKTSKGWTPLPVQAQPATHPDAATMPHHRSLRKQTSCEAYIPGK